MTEPGIPVSKAELDLIHENYKFIKDHLQMQINGLKIEIEQIKKRITRLQEQKADTVGEVELE